MIVSCIQSHVVESSGEWLGVAEPGRKGELIYVPFLRDNECYIVWDRGLEGRYRIGEASEVTGLPKARIRHLMRRRYPWWYAYSAMEQLVGIGLHNPEDANVPRHSPEDLRDLVRPFGGYVLRKDCRGAAAVTVYDFRQGDQRE